MPLNFADISLDVRHMILSLLPRQEQIRLAATCHAFHEVLAYTIRQGSYIIPSGGYQTAIRTHAFLSVRQIDCTALWRANFVKDNSAPVYKTAFSQPALQQADFFLQLDRQMFEPFFKPSFTINKLKEDIIIIKDMMEGIGTALTMMVHKKDVLTRKGRAKIGGRVVALASLMKSVPFPASKLVLDGVESIGEQKFMVKFKRISDEKT